MFYIIVLSSIAGSLPSISSEMERSAPNPFMQTAIDPELLGLLADYGRLKNHGNISKQQSFQTSDTSAMARLSHLSTTSLSRDPYPCNMAARQSRLSDMFSRLQHTPSLRMHDYTINNLRDSDLYPLNTPSRPSHSVVPHSMWTTSAAGQRRYDPLAAQESRDVSNYLESLAYPPNEEISEPPMYYFPDEDDALEGNNNIGQLGIEYDEAAVAEMMAERRQGMGSEGIRTGATITSVSSRQSSRHSSPRVGLLKTQPQKLHATPRTCRLEGSSPHLQRVLASQTASRQPTPNADHPGPVESSGHNKQDEKNNAAAISKVWTSRFDTVPTKDHAPERQAPERQGPTTVLLMDKSAESDQYSEVDHCMDSAAALNELNAKAKGKTKSTATSEIESVGRSSKQASPATVESIAQKKSKDPNGAFAEPAPPTTQARPSRVPPQMVVTEVPRAAPPCDDASGKVNYTVCAKVLILSTQRL